MKNLVKVERAKHNIMQGELAIEMGVNRQTINSIETKKDYDPALKPGVRMARFFKMPAKELFIWEDLD